MEDLTTSQKLPVLAEAPAAIPVEVLFVDLDGTLIATDMLIEGLLLAVRRQPSLLTRLPSLAFQNRAAFKRAVANCATPNVRLLPFHRDVIEYLHEERAAGRKLVLATASDALWANEVATQLGLFDAVLASDGKNNLKGKAKLAAIEAYCLENGHKQFGYLGDSWADRPIWKSASERLAVAPSAGLLAEIDRQGLKMRVFGQPHRSFAAALQAIRPQQWVKNLLLLLPLMLAHEFTALDKLVTTLWGIIAFCCAASATYLLNDLLDIEADRSHPRKRRRPFASGALPAILGPPIIGMLFTIAAAISLMLQPPFFSWLLGLYVVTTILYSLWLKKLVLIDVFILAGLNMLRILAGGAAAHVVVPEWLMAVALFLFVSLAFGKRHSELRLTSEVSNLTSGGRGYRLDDAGLLESIGPTCGYLAVLVLALYIRGDTVSRLYPRLWPLWLICPLLMYWITRFWLLARRGEICDDPLVFAFKDRGSLAVGIVAGVLVLVASNAG